MPLLTPNGRFVVFASSARNLAQPPNAGFLSQERCPPINVFLRDRQERRTTLVSVNVDGTGGGNGDTAPVGFSTNGQFILLESASSNLVPFDTNNMSDIFQRDLAEMATALVSVSTNDGAANGPSYDACMTPDGRFVVFVSAANNLVQGDTNKIPDVFLRDVQARTTTWVTAGSVPTDPRLLTGDSSCPQITPDGRYVSFLSSAKNLVTGVSGQAIYVRDVQLGQTIWASAGARMAATKYLRSAAYACNNHVISDDGQSVAYAVSTAVYAGPTTNGLILRYNLATQTTDVVATNAALGAGPPDETRDLEMSADGRFIAYVASTNSAKGPATFVVLWDAASATTSLVSGDLSGQVAARSLCAWPELDASGGLVAFLSSATNLVSGNVPGEWHLYLHDVLTGTNRVLDAHQADGAGSLLTGASSFAFTPEARYAVFECGTDSMMTSGPEHSASIWLADLLTDETELISTPISGTMAGSANGTSYVGAHADSQDGRYLAFTSEADTLAAKDTNGCRDVFVADLASGTVSLASKATNGMSGNGVSFEPVLSADGRFVCFTSAANDLVPGDTNGATDVFLRDLSTGTTAMISRTPDGAGVGSGPSYSPTISTDGRLVMFVSMSGNLTTNSLHYTNLFIRDIDCGTTWAVTTSGVPSYAATPDFNTIAYLGGNVYATGKIYVWDRKAKAVIATNLVAGGVNTNFAIGPTGEKIAYWSGTSTGATLYVWDRSSNATTRVFTGYLPKNLPVPHFDSIGRRLIFSADQTNHLYLSDLVTGESRLVSAAWGSSHAANNWADSPDISPDGRLVAFRSAATDLVPDDTNGVPDIFIYDSWTGLNTLLRLPHRAGANERSAAPCFSANGQKLFYQSWASNFADQDCNAVQDVFAYSFLVVQLTPDTSSPGAPWLSWPCAAGIPYEVDYKQSLSDVFWQPLAGAITNGTERAWFQDRTAEGLQRFYRVTSF